ncbi:TetR/AcrR family transcriptional regulator [Phyllobacterium meliloti]|uniref:TetR/AcrR family transcriptional regulator n=1 Tax=Phyllobacterium meliloti TaxID=555317 RepID=UPI00351D30B1
MSVEQNLVAKPSENAGPPPLSVKGMRADARRNREKLLEVAAVVFSEHGVEGSLEDIARRAGVGIGTLYRHFPTREHLVEVVYKREVENLCAAAGELSLHHPPDVALEEWMHRFVGYIAAKRGMANSLRILVTSNSELFAGSSGMVAISLRNLVEAAANDDLIRRDIDSTDLLHALFTIYSIPDAPDWRDRSRRLVKLLMDGLRWGARDKTTAQRDENPRNG